MKKIIALLFIVPVFTTAKSQSSTATLDVVSWNIEFFGAPFASGPANKDLQETNVKKILRYIDADLYGLLEVVDTMRFRRLVDSLGNTEYGYFISPFCSGNTTGTGASWTSGQKLAFIYRKSVFSNITARGIMRNSASGYTNWASGRFPYMFSATATINGISKNVNYILIHGKAGNTVDDFTKRNAAATELKDTLDTYFSTTNNYIIGDFNDALHTSIYTGSAISSYSPIIADSTDADHYKSVTLVLGTAGQSSMINFPNVIDNHVISNELQPFYVNGSAQIRTDVVNVVPDYRTAHNTSDHYPVFSKYSLSGVVTSVPIVTSGEFGIKVSPNPFTAQVYIKAEKALTDLKIKLVNMQGQVINDYSYGFTAAGTLLEPALPALARGIYFLQVETKQFKTVVKVVKM